ncbi:hypothetical protein ACQCRJ_18205, partial [Ralstonia pseudosolanacearum]
PKTNPGGGTSGAPAQPVPSRAAPTAPPPGKVYRSGQTGRAADGSPKDPAAAPARQPALPLRDPTTAGG